MSKFSSVSCQCLLVLLFLLHSVWTRPANEVPTTKKNEPVAYPKYQFAYGVNDEQTGDIKEQKEERDGDVVRGEYSLVEPDGTIRRVQYEDDGKSGFKATVTRQGPGVAPQRRQVVLPLVITRFHA